jgi:hypothetical protein
MGEAPGDSGSSDGWGIRVHPLVAKLLEGVEGGESVVELQGFIGPARDGDDSVTLYTTLELTERVLVPRDAIVHVEEPEPDRGNEEPTRVYVRASAELRVISCSDTTIRADEASATLWWGVMNKPKGRKPFSMCRDEFYACIQAAGGDPYKTGLCVEKFTNCAAAAPRRKS